MTALSKTFGTCDVADAAGLRESIVRSWVERGHVVMSNKDRDAAGRGQTRLFSFETALQIAVAAELSRLGFATGHACRLARSFAHSGNTTRLPGQLFRDGKTMLVIYPENQRACVVRADDLTSIFAHSGASQASVAIVDLNTIYRNTAGRLGVTLNEEAMR